MTPFLGEVFGTMILIIFGGGVVAGVVLKHSKAEASGWIVITFGWAMGVTMAIYAVGHFSGAHINPAITIALEGVANDPQVKLSSTPALPDDEILAQLLFNQSSSQLSALQIAQLADAVIQLTGLKPQAAPALVAKSAGAATPAPKEPEAPADQGDLLDERVPEVVRRRAKVVDKLAAAYILQGALDYLAR